MRNTGEYQTIYDYAWANPEAFWRSQAESVAWYEFPKTILSEEADGTYSWFKGGKLNTCYLAVDYHVEHGRGDQPACDL